MKTTRILTLCLLAAVVTVARAASSYPGGAADVPDPMVIDQENTIRREAEVKIQKEILDRILGEGRATVLVNVEVSLESERKDSATAEGQVQDKKGLGDQDYILPWVPAPKTVNKANEVPKDAKIESASGEIASAAVRQVVKRFDVTVIHDDSVGPGQLTLVEEAVRSAYVRYEKVLGIIFKATKFAKYEMKEKIKEGFWDFLKPQYLLPGVIALLLMFFLFGPLWQFLRAVLRAITQRRGADMFSDSNMRVEGSGGKGDKEEGEKAEEEKLAAEMAALQRKQQEEKFVPFAYVDEKNLKRLIYLIRKEPPEVIALVVSYLKPELVKEVLIALTPELQARVAMHMAAIKQMTEAEIRAYDGDIKQKIEFLVGGLHSLLKVLDDVDYKTRDNILEYLKNERPHLYEKVRRHILTFDDLANVPDPALQTVVRELRAENLARALRDVSPAMSEKFFKNMSKGAAALLKEEMEYSRPLTPDQTEEERQKVLAVIKRLETEGRIAIREKIPDDFLEWEDMDLLSGVGAPRPADSAGDPAKAREYAAAGAQLYAEGRYPDALAYFEYAAQVGPREADIFQYLGNTYYALGRTAEALSAYERVLALNPGDESLRQWVEQFRAGVSATA